MNIIKARVITHNYKGIDILKAWAKKDLTPLEIKAMEFILEHEKNKKMGVK
tara:strand:- start:494 stop:646 length:153 start_codon:yes stop_codon:yes gene_type:complete